MNTSDKSLPGVWLLITDTWKLFTTTWNTSVKTSIYFLYVGIAYFLSSILHKMNSAFGLLDTLVSFAAVIATVWIGIRVMLTMLQLEAGKKPLEQADESKKAWSLFTSAIWVGFLTMLAVLGSTLLFVIPGIYFMIALYFSTIILVDQGIKGSQALNASRALVKGRWWGTFGRILAGGIVFGALVGIIAFILTTIAEAIAGPELFVVTKGFVQDPLAVGIQQFLQMAIMAAFMPLLSGFQVKIYRALQKTRS
jgi:hypothetical protein